jgi:hypothetical protein
MYRMWEEICGTQEALDIPAKAHGYLYAETAIENVGSVDIIALPVGDLRSDESLVIGLGSDLRDSYEN